MLGEWMERWEGGWGEWETNKGIVYMWISVRTGVSYIGSTKGTMEERARSHLRMIRKVREAWKKKEKIEDEEITPVHREIAKRPGEWVMIPISGGLINWKRVEKRAIRYFNAELNVKEKKKKKKENKRNRPFKREKNKNKNSNKNKTEKNKKREKINTITTFKIKKKKKNTKTYGTSSKRKIKKLRSHGKKER